MLVNYATSGEKISTFTITYTDNTTLTTYGKIYFQYQTLAAKAANASSCFDLDPYKQDFVLQADLPFTGYAVGDPTIKAKIEYRVFYGNTDKKIRKPIIILDGFDPGDKRKIEDCDCEADTDCAARNTTNGVFDPEKHKSMVDFNEYFDPNIQQITKLIPQLRALGYDVILVNHPKYKTVNLLNGQMVNIDGGAYYIESNAMALVKLLIETKAILDTNASTAQIAIVGPSMGGQISRYALAYMEKNNIPHHTYLWVSVDSPHLGANIPLGDQALLNLVKGSSNEANTFYEKELSSPAAQQQLIEFHKEQSTTFSGITLNNYHLVNQDLLNAQTTTQGMLLNRGNTIFQEHYNRQFANGLPNSDGYPVNLRKLAMVNGSLSGSKESLTSNGQPTYTFANDNEKVLNLRGFQRVNISLPVGSITFRVHIASLEANFLPSSGSGNTQIARFKKLLTDRTTKAPNYNPRGNMDNVPGGYFGAQNEIASPVQNTSPVPGSSFLKNWALNNFSITNFIFSISDRLGGSEWFLHQFNPIHSFIPSFSALGHLQPNQNWANPLNTNLTCPSNKLTPFDSYFGLSKNTQHTSFTKEGVDWLIKELAGQPQAPYFPIQNNALTGPNAACVGSNSTFTFNDLCKIPSAATWTVEGNISIVSFTNYSVVVTGISNTVTWGKIIATFQNGQTLSKTIWVGKPIVPNINILGASANEAVSSSDQMNVNFGTGVATYDWSVSSLSNSCADSNGFYPPGVVLPKFSNGSTNFSSTSNYATINWGNCPGTFLVNCSAVNSCGGIGFTTRVITVYNSTGGGGDPCEPTLQVYPNPASESDFTINLIPPPDPCDGLPAGRFTNSVNHVKMYDLYGNLVYTTTYKTDYLTIKDLNLKKGHYILNVQTALGKSKREIIIVK
jgi:hypothetical protein